MSLESTPDLTQEESTSSKFPVTGWWRVLYGLLVVVLPSFSFWVMPGLKPEWQSGTLDAYLTLLLQPEASVFFLTLLAFSILCYILLLIDADRFSPSFVVRLGIYTGVFLALQYTMILGLYLFEDKYSVLLLLLWFFPLYFPKIRRWTVDRWGRQEILAWIFLFLVIAFVISAIIFRQILSPFLIVWVGLVAAAPFWSFLIASQAAIWLFKNYESKLTLMHSLGITAWLATYTIAWRYDILKMYELYAQLPTQPPDCYIATAAARGHPQLVLARTVERADGTVMQVNAQLQLFKCAELALLGIQPDLHQRLRMVYDMLGKPLARNIQHPLLADIAYLLLKPAEWLARRLLKMVIPEIDSLAKTIYTR